MKQDNKIKIQFPARSVNEGFARMVVGAAIAPLDPTVEELSDLKTAVSEAVTNCVVHAYRSEMGNVYIEITVKDSRVTVKIRDRGCGIPDLQKAMEPLFTTDEAGERAGLGFALMETFTDRVKVRSKVGVGTTVTLQKLILGKS